MRGGSAIDKARGWFQGPRYASSSPSLTAGVTWVLEAAPSSGASRSTAGSV